MKPITSYHTPVKNSGQTLIVILMVMVVSLTIGLAVASRTLSSLRQKTFMAQSGAAYHAAEGGVEEALRRLEENDPACPPSTESCSGSGSFAEAGSTFSYTISIGGGEAADYTLDLEQDKTQEIKLSEYDGSSLTVCWDHPSDAAHEASLELSLVSGAAPYYLEKWAINSIPRDNGFESPPSGDGTYAHCYGLDLSSPQLLRIRALYADTSAVVKPVVGQTLPIQSFIIESRGTAGEVTRKVRVTRSLPSLPSIFDYVLFSGSETEPLSK